MSERDLFPVLLFAWLGLAALVAPVLLFVTAPYGRHARAGWGPAVPARLGWVLMEAPAALLFAVFFATGDHTEAPAALAFLGLWEAHYLHRAFVYPARRPGGRAMPLAVLAFGVVFNCVNAYLNGRWLFALGPLRPPGWLADPRFLGGAALFVAGFAANLHADEVLRRLRRGGGDYQVPQGGLYRFVSSPNYLGEIVEWSGWALATFSLPGLVFAVWTVANLVPRALAHHRWYRRTFPDYPPGRRAILPYLY